MATVGNIDCEFVCTDIYDVDASYTNAFDLNTTDVIVAEQDSRLVGIAQVSSADSEGDTDLMLMFVDPDYFGRGVGRRLLEWAKDQARTAGAKRVMIAADPDAVPFYNRMGAVHIGTVQSESIPGRSLPLHALVL